MAQRVVLMTPRTKGNIKTIQVERTDNLDASQVYHKGSGHLNGIVINKETQNSEPETESQDMQLEFTCLMHNNRTADSHAESRRLKFWFLDNTERSQRLADSYDFFKDLVNQGTFPKDYVGFIKRMLKQLQSDHYPSLRRVDLDIIPLEPSSQEAFVPGSPELEGKPIEVVVREDILRTLEDAYPNVLSVDDLIRITNIDDVGLLTLQLKELQESNVIQSVSIDSAPTKKMGYRRNLQVLHKVEELRGADNMRSLSHEQKPTIAIITNLLCEKLAVDALMERKTTYVRYKTEGDSNVYTIGYIGKQKVISVKLPMVGRELQAKISSGSITTRLLGAFQSIQHVLLVGVGGSVSHVYEFNKHSRLGDIVVSAPASFDDVPEANNVNSKHHQAAEPFYVYCEKIDELSNGATTNGGSASPILFSYRNFAPKDLVLLTCAKSLVSEFKKTPKACAWMRFIDEGLQNLKDNEFDYSRPPPESDKLKLQIGEGVAVDVKHPEPPPDAPWCLPDTSLVRFGCIGSGRPVTDDCFLRDLFANQQHLLAFDAEFDQVLESLLGNGITSFLVVRGMADYVEGRQAAEVFNWQPHAALAAAAFAKALLLQLQTLEQEAAMQVENGTGRQ
ncbi:hypothetical protein AAHC03_010310 [Spirometra sp. Aus1]